MIVEVYKLKLTIKEFFETNARKKPIIKMWNIDNLKLMIKKRFIE